MIEQEMRCPHCYRLLGKASASENSSIVKVLTVAPRTKQQKTMIFENKCPKCNKMIYIEMGFKN